MKHSAEYEAFTDLVEQVLAVPHSEILHREADYKRQVAQNPKRRGPKRKIKPSALDHASTDPAS